MVYLTIQVTLLLLVAFILGAILGCLLRYLFGGTRRAEHQSPAAAGIAAGTAAAAGATTAARSGAPHVPDAPHPVPQPLRAPEPVEPEVAEVPAAAEPVPLVSDTGEKPPAVPPKPAAKPKRERAAKTAAKAKPAAPSSRKAPPPAADPASAPDNLKQIRGIGPQNEARLNGIGVYQFAQIAKWTKKDQREIGERLSFPGRIEREEWVPQAKKLAKGGTTSFSKRVSQGAVKSSVGSASVAGGRKPPMLDAARGDADNLTLIDGVGNAIERKLFKMGVFHFDQIAAWDDEESSWVGNEIGFPGRVQRERWVEEAKVFASGGTTDHARRVEKGQIRTSRKSKPSET